MRSIARAALLGPCSIALAAALACGSGAAGDQPAGGGGAGDGGGLTGEGGGANDARSSVDATTDAGAGADGASSDGATGESAAPLPPGAWGCNVPPPTGSASPGPQPTWVLQGQSVNGDPFTLGIDSYRVALGVDGTSSTVLGGSVYSIEGPGFGNPGPVAPVTFGSGGPLIPYGDAFLVHVDPQGATTWTRILAPTSPDGGATAASISATATNAVGRVAILGAASGSLDLGCGAITPAPPSPGPFAGFLAVLDASGACVWSEAYPSAVGGVTNNLVLALDANGELVVVTSGTSAEGKNDFVLAIEKFDPTGALLWTVKGTSPAAPSEGANEGLGVGVDAQGDIVVGANFRGTLTLGGQVLEHSGTDGALVAKVTAGGFIAWAQAFSTTAPPELSSMAVAPSGAIALTGALATGGALLTCSPATSCDNPAFVAMLGADGAVQWVRFFPTGPWAPIGLFPVAFDPAGGIAVAVGYSNDPCPCCNGGPLNLGGADLPTSAAPPLAIVAYASDGTHRWDTVLRCTGLDGGACSGFDIASMTLAYRPDGDLVLGGRADSRNTLALGNTVVTSPPYPNGATANEFVTRLH